MKYHGLQLMRYVAAALVVLSHGTQMVSQRLTVPPGEAYWYEGTVGVDIFFVISGFVMVLSSRAGSDRQQSPREFLRRRLIRIAPMYWLASALKVATVLLLPALALRTTIDWQHVAASFVFLPWRSPWGEVAPVLPVGWTLNFEMLFYVLFAGALWIAGKTRVLQLALISAGFAAIAVAAHVVSLDALTFWSKSVVLEFLFGAVLAWQRQRLASLPASLGLLLITGGALWIFGPAEWSLPALDIRGIDWGIPSAAIVAGALVLENNPRFQLFASKYERLGDASYSIYLFHTFVLPVLGVILGRLALTTPAVALTASVIISTVLGVVLFSFLERPLTKMLQARFT